MSTHAPGNTRLYTVASVSLVTGIESRPRFDLAPMNHAAACNFMDACRSRHTDYMLIDWPEDQPFPRPPMFATGYRRDKDKTIIATRTHAGPHDISHESMPDGSTFRFHPPIRCF